MSLDSFHSLSLSPALMRSVTELGYEKPSPIQSETLPLLLGDKTDFIGLAATGTGKTAAFSIPLLQKLDPAKKAIQALVLCPTRELALQVAGQINLLGKHLRVNALPIYGGAGYGDQIRGLKQGATIVVGTPGRVIDHMERGTLRLNEVETIVLDEADEMISMGFKDELEKILASAPRTNAEEKTCNIWLFSATMSREIRKVADMYLKEPKQVQVNRKEMLSETVEQIFYVTQEANKPEVLCKLIDAADGFFGVIFCQTKSLVTDLTQYLNQKNYRADCLHGDKDQHAREKTLQSFRDKRVNILVCTDVASRGIDVKDVTHVINYSIPRELDSYVHRIGRTARSGKKGYALSLVTPSHRGLVGRIEQMTKSKMLEGKIPTRKEIGAKKIMSHLTAFLEQKNFSKTLDLMGEEWKNAIAEMPVQEVAARFIALKFPEIFAERDTHELKPTRSLGGAPEERRNNKPSRRDRGDRDRGDRDQNHRKEHRPHSRWKNKDNAENSVKFVPRGKNPRQIQIN